MQGEHGLRMRDISLFRLRHRFTRLLPAGAVEKEKQKLFHGRCNIPALLPYSTTGRLVRLQGGIIFRFSVPYG